MANFFNSVRITNFKSLKDVTLSDCKRINLLIGKPNVGKSNILEAIGLFSLPYFKDNKSKKLTQFVRLENIAELFFDGNVKDKIIVHADDGSHCYVDYSDQQGLVQISIALKRQDYAFLEERLSPIEKLGKNVLNLDYNLRADNQLNLKFSDRKLDRFSLKVKYYKFPHHFESKNQDSHIFGSISLVPPSGSNLLAVIEHNKSLGNELSKLFAEYGLRLLFDKTNQTLRIDKPLKENAASFPFSSIADTLQRIIFFKAAIASNKDSIILFEEPEAHCFPPYITHIAREIIDSQTNQFFIATHSPYILDTFLEKDRNDLAIYMTDFKEGQTVIKRLTDAEINEVYEYGLDLFFNAELFTDEI